MIRTRARRSFPSAWSHHPAWSPHSPISGEANLQPRGPVLPPSLMLPGARALLARLAGMVHYLFARLWAIRNRNPCRTGKLGMLPNTTACENSESLHRSPAACWAKRFHLSWKRELPESTRLSVRPPQLWSHSIYCVAFPLEGTLGFQTPEGPLGGDALPGGLGPSPHRAWDPAHIGLAGGPEQHFGQGSRIKLGTSLSA